MFHYSTQKVWKSAGLLNHFQVDFSSLEAYSKITTSKKASASPISGWHFWNWALSVNSKKSLSLLPGNLPSICERGIKLNICLVLGLLNLRPGYKRKSCDSLYKKRKLIFYISFWQNHYYSTYLGFAVTSKSKLNSCETGLWHPICAFYLWCTQTNAEDQSALSFCPWCAQVTKHMACKNALHTLAHE